MQTADTLHSIGGATKPTNQPTKKGKAPMRDNSTTPKRESIYKTLFEVTEGEKEIYRRMCGDMLEELRQAENFKSKVYFIALVVLPTALLFAGIIFQAR